MAPETTGHNYVEVNASVFMRSASRYGSTFPHCDLSEIPKLVLLQDIGMKQVSCADPFSNFRIFLLPGPYFPIILCPTIVEIDPVSAFVSTLKVLLFATDSLIVIRI